jgi:hypothetical protein
MEGQQTAAQRVTDLQAQLAEAEHAAAAEAAAKPADATPAGAPTTDAEKTAAELAAAQAAVQDPAAAQAAEPPATAQGTGAIAAAPAEAAAAPEAKPVLDLIKELGAPESPHGFIENLRTVADHLEADGRIVGADLLGAGEVNKITATLVKVVGEIVGKL